jgi:hypothetical protein
MKDSTDFVVRSADNTPQLAVEIKTKRQSSADWATALRRNLIAHSQVPVTRFFLLALPDRFYLWKDASLGPNPPQYEVDAKEILSPYLKELRFQLEDMSEQSLELLIRNWLEDVTNNNQENWSKTNSTAQLRQSGLYDAIKDGFISAQVAV